jgi:homoserine O-acetyltransferase/O-succinyltransferase
MAVAQKTRAGTRAPADAWEEHLLQPTAPFVLASGETLADAGVRARHYGDAAAPLVIVMGGISATRRLAGEGGWWGDIVAPGGGVDLQRYSALGIDFAPNDDVRVRISPDDQARLVLAALDGLGVTRAHAFIGASYGGAVGLALAARAPERLERLCVISAAAEPAPLGSAWRGVQRRMVEIARQHGAAAEGLSLARQLAMISYRSAEEFAQRFDRRLDERGQSDLDRYLVARGEAFVEAMGAERWLSLSEAIDRTDIDPARVAIPTTLVACASDQLAPLAQMEALSRQLPQLTGFRVIRSLYGHDAFLKEPAQIGRILRRFLDEAGS